VKAIEYCRGSAGRSVGAEEKATSRHAASNGLAGEETTSALMVPTPGYGSAATVEV